MSQHTLPSSLLILGCGYVGSNLAAQSIKLGIKVKAVVRKAAAAQALSQQGIQAICADTPASLSPQWLADIEAVVDSIPLDKNSLGQSCQTQTDWLPTLLNHIPRLRWAGYLSSTSVYANSDGAWIDESNTNLSNSPRGSRRYVAEQAWLSTLPQAEVFRLAGIYGDQRNILGRLKQGEYQAVRWQPEHFSNRIHVDDIVAALLQAMQKPKAQRIINLADDLPYPHADYALELAALVGAPPPTILNPQQAQEQLSAQYLSFFSDNKRIANQKLHQELLPKLKYPSFREAAAGLC